jgi:hypothetical protein
MSFVASRIDPINDPEPNRTIERISYETNGNSVGSDIAQSVVSRVGASRHHQGLRRLEWFSARRASG